MSVTLFAGLTAGNLFGAPIIQYQITSLGTNSFRYNYTLSGIDLLKNQEIDIRFDPAVFGTLSNGVAGSNFNLLLLQPNKPPGVQGDYSALALIDHSSITGTFSVDFTLASGVVTQPGSQSFFLFDDSITPRALLASGTTTPVTPTVPEPLSFLLCGAGLVGFSSPFRSLVRKLARSASV